LLKSDRRDRLLLAPRYYTVLIEHALTLQTRKR
jgi:hypothetical protein